MWHLWRACWSPIYHFGCQEIRFTLRSWWGGGGGGGGGGWEGWHCWFDWCINSSFFWLIFPTLAGDVKWNDLVNLSSISKCIVVNLIQKTLRDHSYQPVCRFAFDFLLLQPTDASDPSTGCAVYHRTSCVFCRVLHRSDKENTWICHDLHPKCFCHWILLVLYVCPRCASLSLWPAYVNADLTWSR